MKIIDKIQTVLAALLLITALFTAFLLLEPHKASQAIEPLPVLNENKTVSRGDVLVYRIDFEKFQAVPVTSSNSLVCDSGLLLFPSRTTNSPVGKFVLEANFEIPEHAPLGKCVLRSETIAHVNILKDVKGGRETEEFTITK